MQQGFTLIEMLIVLVVIGLLMMVALPAYENNSMRSRRADGMAALLELSASQERFYAANRSYTTVVDTAAGLDYGATTSSEGYYSLSAAACNGGNIGNCYQLSAAPRGGQVGDTDCGTLTLTSTGVRGATGTKGSGCW